MLSIAPKFCAWLALLLAVQTSSPLLAQNWPQFRGPTGQGHVLEETAWPGGPPREFGEDLHLCWKTPIPGLGWSSPVVWENQVWVTTAGRDSQRPDRILLGAIGLNALTGELEHKIPLFSPEHPEPIHDTNSYASPTPVVDAEQVYCHFGTYGTAALNRLTGEIVWKNESLRVEHQGGPGSSPVGYQDLLILTCDGADTQHVTALRKRDGQIVWKRHRSAPQRENPITHRAFTTPIIWRQNGEDLLISPAADQAHAYRPLTGEEVWQMRYVGFSNVPAPVTWESLVFVCTGFFEPVLAAIQSGGQGDITHSHVAWLAKRGVSTIPSPIVVGDRLYALNEGGILTSHDCQTGKVIRKRRFTGNYSASPVCVGGHLYFCSEEGKITVLVPNDTLDILHVNRVNGVIKASPAASGPRLFIRTDSHLYCFEQPIDLPLVTGN